VTDDAATADLATVDPTPLDQRLRRIGEPIAMALLLAQTLRVAAAVAGGFVNLSQRQPGGGFGLVNSEPVGQRLTEFGGAGDGAGAVILMLAVVALWVSASGADARRLSRWRRLCAATGWVLTITGISALLVLVGYSQLASVEHFDQWGQVVEVDGFAAAYVVLAVAGLYVVRGMLFASDDAIFAPADGALGAAVFAVDRKTGDVLTWPSIAEATDEAPVFGVEDEEYDFFLDDGTVVSASVDAEGRVVLSPTDAVQLDQLRSRLKEHARQRGIDIEPDEVDEPLAYVDPIDREHWLGLWPGWLRWIGRLFRPPR